MRKSSCKDYSFFKFVLPLGLLTIVGSQRSYAETCELHFDPETLVAYDLCLHSTALNSCVLTMFGAALAGKGLKGRGTGEPTNRQWNQMLGDLERSHEIIMSGIRNPERKELLNERALLKREIQMLQVDVESARFRGFNELLERYTDALKNKRGRLEVIEKQMQQMPHDEFPSWQRERVVEEKRNDIADWLEKFKGSPRMADLADHLYEIHDLQRDIWDRETEIKSLERSSSVKPQTPEEVEALHRETASKNAKLATAQADLRQLQRKLESKTELFQQKIGRTGVIRAASRDRGANKRNMLFGAGVVAGSVLNPCVFDQAGIPSSVRAFVRLDGANCEPHIENRSELALMGRKQIQDVADHSPAFCHALQKDLNRINNIALHPPIIEQVAKNGEHCSATLSQDSREYHIQMQKVPSGALNIIGNFVPGQPVPDSDRSPLRYQISTDRNLQGTFVLSRNPNYVLGRDIGDMTLQSVLDLPEQLPSDIHPPTLSEGQQMGTLVVGAYGQIQASLAEQAALIKRALPTLNKLCALAPPALASPLPLERVSDPDAH